MADPYVSWEEVADAVQGEDRLLELLAGHDDDPEGWFDHQLAVVQRFTDVALEKAGYVTPMTSITDTLLRHAIIGKLVGLITESSSSREPFIDDLVKGADLYFKELKKGDASVLGAVADTPAADSLIISNMAEPAIFDGPDSEASHVFAPLGRFYGGWRR